MLTLLIANSLHVRLTLKSFVCCGCCGFPIFAALVAVLVIVLLKNKK